MRDVFDERNGGINANRRGWRQKCGSARIAPSRMMGRYNCSTTFDGQTREYALSTAGPGRMPDLSVIIPCYDEEGNLQELVNRLSAAFERFRIQPEILLVDDCSRDGTATLIRQLANAFPCVRGLFHSQNLGIVGGWRSGLAASSAPLVVIMDADLQYAPEDVPRLYQILQREQHDLVQGWRIAHNFKATYRYVLSLGFSFLLNRIFGTSLRDIKSGFLCTRREVFEDMLKTRYQYRFLQHFIIVNAASKGYRVRQEPVLFWNRHAGQSFITSPFRFGLRALTDLPRAFWEFRVLNRNKKSS